jgi:hypothetical protein
MAGIELNWTTEPTTRPGTYRFKREPTSRAIMVEVRVTDRQFAVWCPNPDSRAFVSRLSTN